MRLYTNRKGDWAGTQLDAKKLGGFFCVDVPTMKPELLKFLNLYNVKESIYEARETPSAPVAEPSAPSEPRNLKGGSWDEYNAIRDHLETCDAKALNTALSIITGRLGDLLEKAS
tara:strand:- start:44 stop:388 length:345 start_codon:yes stop_codon:yes gene_type:complete